MNKQLRNLFIIVFLFISISLQAGDLLEIAITNSYKKRKDNNSTNESFESFFKWFKNLITSLEQTNLNQNSLFSNILNLPIETYTDKNMKLDKKSNLKEFRIRILLEFLNVDKNNNLNDDLKRNMKKFLTKNKICYTFKDLQEVSHKIVVFLAENKNYLAIYFTRLNLSDSNGINKFIKQAEKRYKKNVGELYLYFNCLTELPKFLHSNHITTLNLSYNKLNNFIDFKCLPKSLTTLNLSHNDIADITGLEYLSLLKNFQLFDNKRLNLIDLTSNLKIFYIIVDKTVSVILEKKLWNFFKHEEIKIIVSKNGTPHQLSNKQFLQNVFSDRPVNVKQNENDLGTTLYFIDTTKLKESLKYIFKVKLYYRHEE